MSPPHMGHESSMDKYRPSTVTVMRWPLKSVHFSKAIPNGSFLLVHCESKHVRPFPPIYLESAVVAPAGGLVRNSMQLSAASAAFNKLGFETVQASQANAFGQFLWRIQNPTAVFAKPIAPGNGKSETR